MKRHRCQPGSLVLRLSSQKESDVPTGDEEVHIKEEAILDVEAEVSTAPMSKRRNTCNRRARVPKKKADQVQNQAVSSKAQATLASDVNTSTPDNASALSTGKVSQEVESIAELEKNPGGSKGSNRRVQKRKSAMPKRRAKVTEKSKERRSTEGMLQPTVRAEDETFIEADYALQEPTTVAKNAINPSHTGLTIVRCMRNRAPQPRHKAPAACAGSTAGDLGQISNPNLALDQLATTDNAATPVAIKQELEPVLPETAPGLTEDDQDLSPMETGHRHPAADVSVMQEAYSADSRLDDSGLGESPESSPLETPGFTAVKLRPTDIASIRSNNTSTKLSYSSLEAGAAGSEFTDPEATDPDTPEDMPGKMPIITQVFSVSSANLME